MPREDEVDLVEFRRQCRVDFLNYLRVREWQELESQLRQVCKEMKIDLGKPAGRHTERGSGSPERMTSRPAERVPGGARG